MGARFVDRTEMCSGSEAGSYLRPIDFVYHSTLGSRVIKKKEEDDCARRETFFRRRDECIGCPSYPTFIRTSIHDEYGFP